VAGAENRAGLVQPEIGKLKLDMGYLSENEGLRVILQACAVRGHTKEELVEVVNEANKMRIEEGLLRNVLAGTLPMYYDPEKKEVCFKKPQEKAFEFPKELQI
jgi:regulator of replication initiation timing